MWRTPLGFRNASTLKNAAIQIIPIPACPSHDLGSPARKPCSIASRGSSRPLSWRRACSDGIGFSRAKDVPHPPAYRHGLQWLATKNLENLHRPRHHREILQSCPFAYLLIWNELKTPDGSSCLSNAITFIEAKQKQTGETQAPSTGGKQQQVQGSYSVKKKVAMKLDCFDTPGTAQKALRQQPRGIRAAAGYKLSKNVRPL